MLFHQPPGTNLLHVLPMEKIYQWLVFALAIKSIKSMYVDIQTDSTCTVLLYGAFVPRRTLIIVQKKNRRKKPTRGADNTELIRKRLKKNRLISDISARRHGHGNLSMLPSLSLKRV